MWCAMKDAWDRGLSLVYEDEPITREGRRLSDGGIYKEALAEALKACDMKLLGGDSQQQSPCLIRTVE